VFCFKHYPPIFLAEINKTTEASVKILFLAWYA